MAETFTWCPSIDAQGDIKHRVLDAQFGDGYRQSVGDGINNRAQSWPLTFKGKSAYITPIKTFLDNHNGCIPFKWAPPLGTEALFEARDYSLVSRRTDYYIITVTFKQVFA